MNEIAPIGQRDVAAFKPEQTREKIAGLDGDIVRFRALKDWPQLEAAVAAKIDEQQAFVANWDAVVGVNQSPGRGKTNASRHAFSIDDAFDAWGIAQPTVSRWRTWLKHPDRYHERIMRGSYRAAGLIEPDEVEYQMPVIPAGKFGTIIVDPPWNMQKIEREVRPNQIGFDYPTMTEAELAAWPVVNDLAAEDCHLFCWTTQRFLPAAIALTDHWGFRYCLTMVWAKPGGMQPMGLPQYNCEFVVYGRRGAPSFVETRDFFCCFSGARREHSRKPDGFYDVIRRVTAEPRIDVFSREVRDGFAQFGNETGKFSA
jgi:N6-adenosine-specific RNA methylase IME4